MSDCYIYRTCRNWRIMCGTDCSKKNVVLTNGLSSDYKGVVWVGDSQLGKRETERNKESSVLCNAKQNK